VTSFDFIATYWQTWFTSNLGNDETSTTTWVGHDHITYTHFPCLATSKCKLLQALQKQPTRKNNNIMVRNNYNATFDN
jgi:hypothetical protein